MLRLRVVDFCTNEVAENSSETNVVVCRAALLWWFWLMLLYRGRSANCSLRMRDASLHVLGTAALLRASRRPWRKRTSGLLGKFGGVRRLSGKKTLVEIRWWNSWFQKVFLRMSDLQRAAFGLVPLPWERITTSHPKPTGAIGLRSPLFCRTSASPVPLGTGLLAYPRWVQPGQVVQCYEGVLTT